MKDSASAYSYYCKAFRSDDKNRADAAYKIGLCHLKGIGTTKNYEYAYEWFLKGARLGSTDSMYMLGECYFYGVGTAADPSLAVNCFIDAEEQIAKSGDESGRYCSLRLALAQCLEKGIGTEVDQKRARLLYKAAAESGRANAMYRMGYAVTYGIGMKAEYAGARNYFLRSARKGYAPAMLMMGIFSDQGRGVPKNKSDAQNWYLKVVNSEDEPRMTVYDFPERFAEELKLYTEAKIKAQYRYGMSLASHVKTIQSYVEAFEHISLAASMGYPPAHNEIAKIHSSGGDLHSYFEGPFFVPDSYVETSDSLYSKPVLGEAMNKLGDTFFEGKNIQKNEAAAARCYRFAAELGNIDASYSYGWCLRHGVGVRENDSEAIKWLKMAADKGNSNAAYSYGLACEEGSSTGVKNKREALYYYRMAAGAGHREAAERFLRLSERDEQ